MAKDKPKLFRMTLLQALVSLAVSAGFRGAHDTPYSEASVNARYRSR